MSIDITSASGARDRLSLTSGFPNSRDVTAMIWAYVFSAGLVSYANLMSLQSATADEWELFFNAGAPDTVRFYFGTGSLGSSSTPVRDKWLHVCGAASSTADAGTGTVYHDGLNVGTATKTDPAITPTEFSIGSDITTVDSSAARILVRGCKVWNRTLSDAEVPIEKRYIYPVSYVGLYDFWPLDSVDDLVGRYGGNILTVTGSTPATHSDNPPAIWQPEPLYPHVFDPTMLSDQAAFGQIASGGTIGATWSRS